MVGTAATAVAVGTTAPGLVKAAKEGNNGIDEEDAKTEDDDNDETDEADVHQEDTRVEQDELKAKL